MSWPENRAHPINCLLLYLLIKDLVRIHTLRHKFLSYFVETPKKRKLKQPIPCREDFLHPGAYAPFIKNKF